MDKNECLSRFKKLLGSKGPQTNPTLYLSDNAYFGIPKKLEEEKFFPLGKLRIKNRETVFKYLMLKKDFGVSCELLYQAMRVIRRRRKIYLGLYLLTGGWVFAIRNGEAIVLIAPTSGSRYESDNISLSKFFKGFSEKRWKEFQRWEKIINGKNLAV